MSERRQEKQKVQFSTKDCILIPVEIGLDNGEYHIGGTCLPQILIYNSGMWRRGQFSCKLISKSNDKHTNYYRYRSIRFW